MVAPGENERVYVSSEAVAGHAGAAGLGEARRGVQRSGSPLFHTEAPGRDYPGHNTHHLYQTIVRCVEAGYNCAKGGGCRQRGEALC